MKKYAHVLTLFLFCFSCCSLQADTASVDTCKKLFDAGILDQAIEPCTQAAKNNDQAAQSMLGEIYNEKGDSVNSALWWNKAADAGYQPARNLLALKYYYGGTVFGPEKGWEKNFKKAFSIWHKDAISDIASSQFMVGVMYQKGEGVEVNQSEAWYWLQRALGNGYKIATDVLIELSREITPAQRRLGELKVAAYKKQKSADASMKQGLIISPSVNSL